MTDNDATSASVRFNAEPKGNWLPTEIFVKAGSPFERWKNLTADIFARTSGLLTRRQAMAQAIQQIDSGKVHNCPADISGTSFRAGLRGRGGWQFEVETTAEPAKRFLFIGIEDRTGQVSSTGFSAQPSHLPTSGNCETAEEVRSWPEYEIAVARARADDKTFAAACDEVRPKVEAAIAAVRPEFKDRAHNLIFAQRGSRPGAGVANYVDVEHDRVPLFTFSFDYDRSTPRLTTALMIVPPSGNEPDPRDEQAWKSFASSTIEKVLGVKPTAHRQQFTSSHRPVQTDEENSGMTVDSMSSNWTADVNGREVTLPQVCRIERYLNGNYYFYWNSNAPLPEIDAALAAMRAGLPVSEEQAGKIAVKAAGLRYPDLSLDDWYISHATLQLPAFGGLEARSTHARTSGASPTWNIRLRESDKSRRYITAAIDARSGDVLDVEAKTTPVE
jgi:hypothetical protein